MQRPRAPLEVSTPGDVCAPGQPWPGPRNPVQVAAGSEPGPTFHVQEELRGAGTWMTTRAHGLLGACWVHPAYHAPPTRPAGWTGASRAHDGCSHLSPQHAGCKWTDHGPTLGSGSLPSTFRLGSNLGPALGHPLTPGDMRLETRGDDLTGNQHALLCKSQQLYLEGGTGGDVLAPKRVLPSRDAPGPRPYFLAPGSPPWAPAYPVRNAPGQTPSPPSPRPTGREHRHSGSILSLQTPPPGQPVP